MDKRVLSIYTIPTLTSIVLWVVLIALDTVTKPLDIISILMGSLLGMITLDLEFIIYAYFIEPNKDFSKDIKGYVKHKDLDNLIKYIDYHRNELKEKTVNSAIFQIIFAIFAIFALSATGSYFMKALVLSIYANLMYRALEAYFDNHTEDWFWAFKSKPQKQSIVIYLVGVFAVFVYCLTLF